MGRIFYMMGKSASGKDSIFQMLTSDRELNLKTVTMYTTRPRRDGEQDGKEYFFRDEAFRIRMEQEGKIIECRTYETVCGPWSYFTLDDGQIETDQFSYLMIGTLESFENTKNYFEKKGWNVLVPIYICVEDGERLLRAVKREQRQTVPNYAEVCRRFLADEKDFSEDRLRRCGIGKAFENRDLKTCAQAVKKMIIGELCP